MGNFTATNGTALNHSCYPQPAKIRGVQRWEQGLFCCDLTVAMSVYVVWKIYRYPGMLIHRIQVHLIAVTGLCLLDRQVWRLYPQVGERSWWSLLSFWVQLPSAEFQGKVLCSPSNWLSCAGKGLRRGMVEVFPWLPTNINPGLGPWPWAQVTTRLCPVLYSSSEDYI